MPLDSLFFSHPFQIVELDYEWRCSAVLVSERLRQEDHEFVGNLGYIMRPYFKNAKTKTNQPKIAKAILSS